MLKQYYIDKVNTISVSICIFNVFTPVFFMMFIPVFRTPETAGIGGASAGASL